MPNMFNGLLDAVTLIVPTLDRTRGALTAAAAAKSAGVATRLAVMVDQQGSGFTATVNRGLALAMERHTHACILVDDARPQTDGWLRALKSVVEMRQDVWFAGPSGPCRTPPQNGGSPHDGRAPQYVSHLAGFCLLIAYRALQRLGFLRADLEHYGSDVDYQWRGRRLGGRAVWVPFVFVGHELHEPNAAWWKRDNERFNQIWR